MPIVFVHGVNNRIDDPYRENEVGRDGFLREIVAPSLGSAGKDVSIFNPYWGQYGARFAWGMTVLPAAGEPEQALGGEDKALDQTVSLVAMSNLTQDDIAEHARRDLKEAVDLIYGSALAGARDHEESSALALSYLQALRYVEANPKPSWLATAKDSNFADLLNYHVHAAATEQSLGAGGLRDKLKEAWSRLKNAIPRVGTQVLGKFVRQGLNATVTRFAGDAFVYLAKRGEPGKEGAIVTEVIAALEQAEAAKTDKDKKLIVIAHSFGGEIMYDILTKFRPQLSVDCFITVGSQVGLFEEMKLYLASEADVPKEYPAGRVPLPKTLRRWLNVFDPNDILSYKVSPIFERACDFQYDTGYSSLQAHGGYFLRPSFYVRLAARLQEGADREQIA